MNITIANAKDLPPVAEWEPWMVYVGRRSNRRGLKRSPLANPWPVGQKYGKPPVKRTLEESLALYRPHLMGAMNVGVDGDGKRYPTTLRIEVDRLLAMAKAGPLTLVCWCEDWDGEGEAPGLCHAEIVREKLLAPGEAGV